MSAQYSHVYLLARRDGIDAMREIVLEFHRKGVEVTTSVNSDTDMQADSLKDSIVIFVATDELMHDSAAMRTLRDVQVLDVPNGIHRIIPVDGGSLSKREFMAFQNDTPLELGGRYPEGIMTPIERIIEHYGLKKPDQESGLPRTAKK